MTGVWTRTVRQCRGTGHTENREYSYSLNTNTGPEHELKLAPLRRCSFLFFAGARGSRWRRPYAVAVFWRPGMKPGCVGTDRTFPDKRGNQWHHNRRRASPDPRTGRVPNRGFRTTPSNRVRPIRPIALVSTVGVVWLSWFQRSGDTAIPRPADIFRCHHQLPLFAVIERTRDPMLCAVRVDDPRDRPPPTP